MTFLHHIFPDRKRVELFDLADSKWSDRRWREDAALPWTLLGSEAGQTVAVQSDRWQTCFQQFPTLPAIGAVVIDFTDLESSLLKLCGSLIMSLSSYLQMSLGTLFQHARRRNFASLALLPRMPKCHCFDNDPFIETRSDVPQSWDHIDGLTAP